MSVAWVTGARGFIGRHLARALFAEQMTVAGLGHGAWPEDEAAFWGVTQWLNGDITPANMDRLATLCGAPELIFHLAGGSAVGGPSILRFKSLNGSETGIRLPGWFCPRARPCRARRMSALSRKMRVWRRIRRMVITNA